jgi:hypothetical protein
MPTYDVVSGDTVWALSRRALTEYLGRPPTNREVLEIVNQVQVPSGDVNLIFPGEQVTIPVGRDYGASGGDIQADDPAPRPPQATPDAMERFREVERGAVNPIEAQAMEEFAGGPTRFAPRPFSGDSFRSMVGRPLENEYRDFNWRSGGDWRDMTKEAVGDMLPFIPGGVIPRGSRLLGYAGQRLPALPFGGRPALPSGGRPALPSGQRPALPSGQRPALPAGPSSGPSTPPGGGWSDRWWGSGGYTY